ncbi:MAG: class I SAM-dependent methyltransferase [Methylobacterium frigidaeris]
MLPGHRDWKNIRLQRGNAMDQDFSHKGDDYRLILKEIHENLNPKTYLEIGTREGGTLALSRCPSIAIDPYFVLDDSATGTRKSTLFFQTTSDDFFENYDPCALLKQKMDFCFLDGLHEWETLLRDFINTEKHCKPNSIIAIHDCLPSEIAMASRTDNGAWWTGDVWKILPILSKYRPDLKIFSLDAPPTGLIFVTGLNPGSTRLAEQYFDIVEEWRHVELENHGLENLFRNSNVLSTSLFRGRENLSRYFWL